jgi:hypothetical protein
MKKIKRISFKLHALITTYYVAVISFTISDVNIYDAGWKEVPGESQWQG